MLETWKRLRESKNLSLVNAIIGLGRTALAAGLFALPLIGAAVFPSWAPALIAGTIAAFSVLAAVWITAHIMDAQNARKLEANPYVKTIEGRHTAIVHAANDVEYRVVLKLKYIRSNIASYAIRFNWTGDGEIDVRVQNRGARCELDTLASLYSHILRINFAQPRDRGTEEVLSYSIRCRGTRLLQRPFYSVTTQHLNLPRLLEVQVEFGPGVKVKGVHKELYVSKSTAYPVGLPEPMEVGSNRKAIWAVTPKRNHRYCISWEFENDSQL